jgi:hypothetical protein
VRRSRAIVRVGDLGLGLGDWSLDGRCDR